MIEDQYNIIKYYSTDNLKKWLKETNELEIYMPNKTKKVMSKELITLFDSFGVKSNFDGQYIHADVINLSPNKLKELKAKLYSIRAKITGDTLMRYVDVINWDWRDR